MLSRHHPHWKYCIFHVILASYSNWYGTDYPSAAHELISGYWWDSCCISLIFSICWRGYCLFLSFVIVFAACLSWFVLISDFVTFVSHLGLNVSVQTWHIISYIVGFNNVPHEIMSTGYFCIVNIVHGQYLLILMCPGHNLPMK